MTETQDREHLVDDAELNEAEQEAPVQDRATDDGRERQYPCHQCGASLKWEPGAASLACPYCGHKEELPQDEKSISEYAFNDYIITTGKDSGLGLASRTLKCSACAAEVELAADEAAHVCAFCGSNAIDETAHEDRIQPEAIIPFAKDADQARVSFRAWLKKLWFAPNDLKRIVRADTFQGIYRPWWTFDSHTMSHWSGYAGYYYYVTRTRTRNGKTETYQERKTRWHYRSGSYESFFDDELTAGFRDALNAEGYQLRSLKPYDPSMIAGYLCERYVLDPKAAWPQARASMESVLYDRCRDRLGGDTQRGLSVKTAHSGITFKSLLLPAWHSAYRYKGKLFKVIVNGQNGTVTAQRPYSWIKITLLVLLIAAIITGIIIAVNMQ